MSNIINFPQSYNAETFKEWLLGELDILNIHTGVDLVNSTTAMAFPPEKQALYEFHRDAVEELTKDPIALKSFYEMLGQMDDDVESRTVGGMLGFNTGAQVFNYKDTRKVIHIIQVGYLRFIRAITDPLEDPQA